MYWEFIFPSDGPQPNWNCSRIINHSHTSHITYTQRMRTREPYAWHTEYSYQFTKTLYTTFPRCSARYKLLWQSSVTFIQHQDLVQDQHQDAVPASWEEKNPKKGKKNMRKELKNNNTAGDIFYGQYSLFPSHCLKVEFFRLFWGIFMAFSCGASNLNETCQEVAVVVIIFLSAVLVEHSLSIRFLFGRP